MAKTEILSKIGVGSGLDTSALIEALVEADTVAQKENLDKLEENAKNKISAFSVLKSNLKDFKDIVSQIQSQQQYGFVGQSSDATVATLTASGSKAGSTINSSLTVTTLATSHSLTGPSYNSPTATVGARTLTINFGTWSADPTSGGGQSLTSNGQDQIQITTSSSSTLVDLRDAINSAATDSDNDGEKDVNASIIFDGTNYMLMLKSESGASNEMKISDNHASPTYAYDATDGAQLTQRVAGIDAAFTVDGISMTRSSNSFDDLFDGFTLDLKKTSSSAIRISSEVDLDSVKTLVEGYVGTYNEVMQSLTIMGQNDMVEDENDGALIGDSTLREVKAELREMSSTAIGGYEGGPYYLSFLGVSTQRDGSLNFDPKRLETQFKAKPETVRAFFTNNYATSNSNITIKAFDFVNTKPGSYAFTTDGSTHSIGGVSATKSGDVYSVASGNPQGLSIEVTNGSGVTSGTIYYGKSFLNLLTDKLDNYLKFNSIIDTRMNNLNDTIRTVSEKRIALESRIEKLTQRYATQYSAMESTVAQFQETGNMLTSMLESKD
ncbi:MAG: flagellar filament capping protein FliD [Alphaproteobacteria bacterium]|tara:strand:+ start:855 stop:2510 length:1656 start_codon:yes stop_codon:yes gene_type:complete